MGLENAVQSFEQLQLNAESMMRIIVRISKLVTHTLTTPHANPHPHPELTLTLTGNAVSTLAAPCFMH